MTDIITGKIAILEYCAIQFKMRDWRSVRRWKRELSFPIRYLPNNAPFIIPSEVIAWAMHLDDLVKKQK